MKFGTRLVLYYSLASVLAMLVVGFVVLKNIEKYWINTVKEQVMQQNKAIQDYIKQVFIFEKQETNELNEDRAKRIVSNLSSGIGQLQIYDPDLKLLSGLVDVFEYPGFNFDGFQNKILIPAQKGSSINSIQNNIFFSASPIVRNDKLIGVLVISYKLSLLNIILGRIVYILLTGALIFCITIIILSIYISKKMVIPIKRLVVITENYAKRNFSIINIDRKDEFGQLSSSINNMGLQLKDYINRQKQFVSNVSHEIRTPLTAIKGYSEYLYDEVGGNPNLGKVVYHLNNETARLTSLVNDLLQLSRMDSSKECFSFSKTNFSRLLVDTIEKMQDRACNHGIQFCPDIQSEVLINADSEKLIQVIVNILDNSIKYSSADSKVYIKLCVDGDFALMTISDQGIGIPEEDMKNVFDRFYRASNVEGITGTGLGLAISKEIIDKHNGHISMENIEQGGTMAQVALPLA